MRAEHFERGVVLATVLAPATGGLIVPTPTDAQSAGIEVDIASMQFGQEFTFWHTGGGGPVEWRVVFDPTAAHQAAIAQISADATDYAFR